MSAVALRCDADADRMLAHLRERFAEVFPVTGSAGDGAGGDAGGNPDEGADGSADAAVRFARQNHGICPVYEQRRKNRAAIGAGPWYRLYPAFSANQHPLQDAVPDEVELRQVPIHPFSLGRFLLV